MTAATTHPTVVAPSILAADIGDLLSQVRLVEQAGADWLHVDVMDGSFVPAITFGTNVVSRLRDNTKLFLDTHLMVVEPERHIEDFKKAGSDRITVHQETCPHLHRTLQSIKALGVSNGVAINPSTPVESIFHVLPVCDLVLIMTVNPGWGGQSFIHECVAKMETLRQEIERRNLPTVIEVDGGINGETSIICRKAGVTALVAGSAIFGTKDYAAAIREIRG